MASRPTLDPAPLAAWRAQTRDIDPSFVRSLIDDFLSDTQAQLAILVHATEDRDATTCQFVAHRLLSSCNAIGAFQLASLLEEMELLAKNGAVVFLASQFAKIEAEYRRLESTLNLERAAVSGTSMDPT